MSDSPVVESADPLRARVSFTCDDDRLDLVVDANLEAQSVERHAG